MPPVVSIITPTYNHELFIGSCIESVLNQTYQNWEHLIIDDGSTDKTWQIVTRFASKDSRIKPLRQKNKGIWRLSETYNTMLAQSKGSVIAILEGDDYWPNNKLADQLAAHTSDVSLSYGISVMVTNDGQTIGLCHQPPFCGRVDHVTYLKMLLLRQSGIQPVSVLLSADKLKSIGGFHQGQFPAVDYPTFVRLSQISGDIVFEAQIWGYWRQHDSQVTASKGIELIEGRLRISLEQYASLSDELRKKIAISEKDIRHAHRSGLSDSYLAAVRSALIQKDLVLLHKYLAPLWKYGNMKRKIQSIYALLAIRIGWNMEPLLQLYERLLERQG